MSFISFTTMNLIQKDHFYVTLLQSVTGKLIKIFLLQILIFNCLVFRCAVLSSVACMVMLSLQRVLAIRSLDKTRSSYFTPKKIFAYMLTLWITLVSLHLPTAFGVWGRIGQKPGYPFCTMTKEDGFFYPDTLLNVFGYALPLTVLVISYSLMYKQLNDFTFRTGKEGQVTKSALIMIGSFVFIYAPAFLDYFFNNLSEGRGMPSLTATAYIISWSHAFINPFINIFCNSYYRKEYLRVVGCKEEKAKRNTIISSRTRNSSQRSESKRESLLNSPDVEKGPLK